MTREPDPDILSHYESFDEETRLTSDTSRLEYARTRTILERYLHPPPGVVLDIGGGPGAYACWLARKGYEVHLVDPVPGHVEKARAASSRQPDHPLAGASTGDARDLGFDTGAADVALLLGPLYHLTERTERVRALHEAARVLRPGGLMVSAAITRFASLLDGAFRGFRDDPAFEKIMERDLAEGQHRNTTGNPSYFTTAFFHHPDELVTEVTDAGLDHQATLAVEGPMWLLADFDRVWSDAGRRKRLLGDLERIETEPSMLGVSAHLIAIARKT